MSSQPRYNTEQRNGPYNQNHRKKDLRIYTVKVSTNKGPAIYKAWEHSDKDMDDHFRGSERRILSFTDARGEINNIVVFSFTDARGKIIHNVDVNSGWKHKRTLRWNPHKISLGGSKGDWQDIRQWHNERKQKKTHHPPYPESEPETTQEDIDKHQMFLTPPPISKEQRQENIDALEAEKTELIKLLNAT